MSYIFTATISFLIGSAVMAWLVGIWEKFNVTLALKRTADKDLILRRVLTPMGWSLYVTSRTKPNEIFKPEH
jgi:hypothetical protein